MAAERAKNLVDVFNLFRLDALKDEQLEFYQPMAAVRGSKPYELHESLYNWIDTARNNAHLLVLGHVGCGKSTELNMLSAKLKNNKVPSVTVDAFYDLNLFEFSYVDILIRIIEKIAEYASNESISINGKLLHSFRLSLYTKNTERYWESLGEARLTAEAEASVSLPLFLKFVSNLATTFSLGSGVKEQMREEIKPKMEEITKTFNAFIDEVNSQTKNKMVIIIDGLEKSRSENVRKLFADDISTLIDINTHLIIACPLGIYRSLDAAAFKRHFNKPEIMPMIKTHESDSIDTLFLHGIEMIKKMVYKRVDSSFFENGVLDRIIIMAGGNLRDTSYLIENSAFDAYMSKRDTVDMASAERTINDYASDLFLMVSINKYGNTLKAIYEGSHETRHDGEIFDLLYAGIVFEYNGKRWIDLHPLIRKYIDEHPGILD